MKYRQLGRTGIEVSVIGLGTMTWGEQNSEADAHRQLDYAVDQGVNLIDTAELYATPVRPETQGRTETHIGNWLKARGRRDDLVIATKAAGPGEWVRHIRDGRGYGKRADLVAAVEASLQRLQTDYIDLYQLHWPERDTNFFGRLGYSHAPDRDGVPIAETLHHLGELVAAGKIRHVGVSNETAWGVAEWLRAAAGTGLPRIVSVQNPYSLLNRSFEVALAEFACREQTGLLAYSPLAFGTLSGKYLDGAQPPGARLTLFGKYYRRYLTEAGVAATAAYVQLARGHGLDPAHMALAFVNGRQFTTSTLVGATTLVQLQSNIASVDRVLSPEVLADIEAIHGRYPFPCP